MYGLVRRLWPPAAVAVAGASSVVALLLRDPHVHGSWGECPILATTGYYCPGCGGLRAVADLVHGRVVTALDENLMAVALTLGALVVWAAWAVARGRGRRFAYERWLSTTVLYGLAAVTVVFTVVRNLPIGAWLAP